jgi:hypothetical protein
MDTCRLSAVWVPESATLPADLERTTLTTQEQRQWPTWMIVVVILLLAGPAIWALSIFMHIIAAMSIVGILVVVAIVALFIYLNKRVNG